MAELVVGAKDRAAPYFKEGASEASEGRLQDAIITLRQGLAIQPDNAEGHNQLGEILAKMPGMLPEAISEFQTALKLKPSYIVAQRNLKSALERERNRS